MGICKNSDKLLAKSLGKALKGCDADFIGLDTLNSFSSSMCGFIPGVGQHEVTQLRNVSGPKPQKYHFLTFSISDLRGFESLPEMEIPSMWPNDSRLR